MTQYKDPPRDRMCVAAHSVPEFEQNVRLGGGGCHFTHGISEADARAVLELHRPFWQPVEVWVWPSPPSSARPIYLHEPATPCP